jgi:hypothetical protein
LHAQIKGRSKKTQRDDSQTSSDTESESATTSPLNSMTSNTPSSGSKRVWKQPTTVREFTSQVNAVASKVLNGQLGLETARTYSSLARVVAQTVTAEANKARFMRHAPDLSFDNSAVFEDEDDDVPQ